MLIRSELKLITLEQTKLVAPIYGAKIKLLVAKKKKVATGRHYTHKPQ